MSFSYNSETHEYALDGTILPHPTGALAKVGLIDYSGVPLYVLENARQRGSYIDGCLRLLDSGELDETAVHADATNYISAYKLWKEREHFKPWSWGSPKLAEFDGLRYGMTEDIRGELDSSPAIVDVKCTSSIPKSLGPQLAAYVLGHPERKWNRVGLQLFPDGTYRQYVYECESDFDMWFAALYAAWWEPERKLVSRRKKCQG